MPKLANRILRLIKKANASPSPNLAVYRIVENARVKSETVSIKIGKRETTMRLTRYADGTGALVSIETDAQREEREVRHQ